MPADAPTIVATSGGHRRHPNQRRVLDVAPLLLHCVELSGVHGRRPKLCYVGTASGDQRADAQAYTDAGVGAGFDVTHLNLFPMPNVEDITAHLLEQDVVWVNGGSVANLLAVWRVHGLDRIMPVVWQAGVVLSGVSAGSICWHTGGTTDSYGPTLQPMTNGLGLLPYGNGVHYDSEPQRRPLVHSLVANGTLGLTYCTDDGAGLVYRGTELVEAITERRTAAAYRVERDPATGEPVETRLDTRVLPGAL